MSTRISAAAALLAAAPLVAACGEEADCGPGDAPADGVTLTIGDQTLRYGAFESSPNNDCTAGAVTSLTVEGRQVDAPDRLLVLCLPAPDALGAAAVDLADDARVQVIDVYATLGGCTASLERGTPPAGQATFAGMCADGTDPAGYAVGLEGTIALRRTCGDAIDTVTASLGGVASVVSD